MLANLTIKWGHPEDALAVGLVLYARARGRSWSMAPRWLAPRRRPGRPAPRPLGGAGAGDGGSGRGVATAGRSGGPDHPPRGGRARPALLADWHQLSYWLTRQPNYPDFNHYTPWTSLSPSLTYQGYRAVAGGPGRLYALVSVAVLSVLIVRGRPRLDRIVLALGVAYLARVAFESVLDSYYVWPVLTVAILLASRKGWPRLVATFAIAVVATWFSNADWQGIWPWWSIMMVLLVVVLAAAWPGRDRASRRSIPARRPPSPRRRRSTNVAWRPSRWEWTGDSLAGGCATTSIGGLWPPPSSASASPRGGGASTSGPEAGTCRWPWPRSWATKGGSTPSTAIPRARDEVASAAAAFSQVLAITQAGRT